MENNQNQIQNNQNQTQDQTIEKMERILSQGLSLDQIPVLSVAPKAEIEISWRHYPTKKKNVEVGENLQETLRRISITATKKQYTSMGVSGSDKYLQAFGHKYYNPNPTTKVLVKLDLEYLCLFILSLVSPISPVLVYYILKDEKYRTQRTIFGFNMKKIPNHKYLSSILATISPDHWLFNVSQDEIQETNRKLQSMFKHAKELYSCLQMFKMFGTNDPMDNAYKVLDLDRSKLLNYDQLTDNHKKQIAFIVKNMICLGASGLNFTSAEKQICPFYTQGKEKTIYDVCQYGLNEKAISEMEEKRKKRYEKKEQQRKQYIQSQKDEQKVREQFRDKLAEDDFKMIDINVQAIGLENMKEEKKKLDGEMVMENQFNFSYSI